MFCLLLSESVLLLLAPHVHNLPVLVHLHGVIHQSIHVDELDALLLSIKQHWRDDRQLSHLLLCVLPHTHTHTNATQRNQHPQVSGLVLRGKISDNIVHILTRIFDMCSSYSFCVKVRVSLWLSRLRHFPSRM